jgi:hypothetical protein
LLNAQLAICNVYNHWCSSIPSGSSNSDINVAGLIQKIKKLEKKEGGRGGKRESSTVEMSSTTLPPPPPLPYLATTATAFLSLRDLSLHLL